MLSTPQREGFTSLAPVKVTMLYIYKKETVHVESRTVEPTRDENQPMLLPGLEDSSPVAPTIIPSCICVLM